MRPIVALLVSALALAGSGAATAGVTATPPPEPAGFWTGPVNDPVPVQPVTVKE